MDTRLGQDPYSWRASLAPGLVHLAPAQLGRADSGVLRRKMRTDPRRANRPQRRRPDRETRLECLVREIRGRTLVAREAEGLERRGSRRQIQRYAGCVD